VIATGGELLSQPVHLDAQPIKGPLRSDPVASQAVTKPLHGLAELVSGVVNAEGVGRFVGRGPAVARVPTTARSWEPWPRSPDAP
jgi:hypothetical protein